jgi:gluconokinase
VRAEPLVLTVDVGSSSVRALGFGPAGLPVSGGCRVAYEMDTTPDGGVEIDADRLLALVAEALDGLLAGLGSRAEGTVAVALSTIWHTVLGLDGDDRPGTPLYSWADTRSAADVEPLRARLDERAYHARVGCRLHTSYLPARLAWLRRHDPARFGTARRFLSFGEYLALRLFGEARASVSMASGTGLLDRTTLRWDAPTLAALGLGAERLSPIDDTPQVGLRPPFASRWPGLRRVPWFPAWGDGACSNVGAGCVGAERAALMVGTSGAMRVCAGAPVPAIPDGLWCYRVDARRTLLGGSLSNGGSLYAWLTETLRLPPEADIERELAAMAPDAHGLAVLPFLAGERSTGWRARARGSVVGLSLATRPLDILRAGLETVAYRFALVDERLREAYPARAEVMATGAALLHSPAWTQIVADVLGVPVTPSGEPEGSSRGAALLALERLGSVGSVETVPARRGSPVLPDPARHARYQAGLRRHRQLYELLLSLSEPDERLSA